MIINEAQFIYFSPTHTSKQVAEAIVHGTGIKNMLRTNLTLNSVDESVIPSSTLAVIVVPVYGGRVAPLAMERLGSIRGEDTPTVLVVVYGNRAYEGALIELDTFALSHGFKVIAGATFIGEHSYSSERYPISAGRPNEDDLKLAYDFGYKIGAKIMAASGLDTLYPVDVCRIQRPKQPLFSLLRFFYKVLAQRKSGIPLPKTPKVVDESRCTHCGVCADHCPVGAITKGDELCTDPTKCIKCCACVKSCSRQARVYDTPFAVMLSQCFERQKEPRILI